MSNTYRKYDSSIIEAVILSENINLFPELNIPRSTALSWLRSSKPRVRIKNISIDEVLQAKIEKLENELRKERSRNCFITEFFKKVEGKNKLYSIKKNKVYMVKTFQKYKKWLSQNEMAKMIGINSSESTKRNQGHKNK